MSLVCALILLFISRTLALHTLCQPDDCPAGYHKYSSCGDNNSWNKCQECETGSYMNSANTERTCIQCKTCRSRMVVKTQCNSTANVVCVQQRRLGFTRGYRVVTHLYTNTATTNPTTNTTTTTTTNGTKVTAIKDATHVHSAAPLNPLVWGLLLALMLPLTCCVHVLYKYQHRSPCWRDKLSVKAPLQTDSERDCLQSPTTLDFTISEETIVMDVMCPVPRASPAHSAHQLPKGEHRDQNLSEPFPAIVLYAVIKEVPLRRWKELMRLLSVADRQLERVELDAGLSSMERQYQQLRLWSRKPAAKMEDVYSALHYMELTGCAQMIRENVNQLHSRAHREGVV